MDVTNLRDALRKGVVTVKFKKVNGDVRVMDCTLNMDLIPEDAYPKGKIEISEEKKESTLRV